MLLWLLIVILATLVGGALIFAARSAHRSGNSSTVADHSHFQSQLSEIESDLKVNRLTPGEADSAKAELAREVIKYRNENEARDGTSVFSLPGYAVTMLAFAGPLLALGLYALVGQPHLPAQPLAGRNPPAEVTFEDALAQIEAQMVETPDDIRGWQALAPAYMRAERFADAERAFARIVELGGRNADALTNLAEAKLMQQSGVAGPDIIALFTEAAALDPENVRPRFYLAGEATRAGDWDEAIAAWQELLLMASGDEPWLAVARNGLTVAESRGEPPTNDLSSDQFDPDQLEMIAAMVDQLTNRLAQQGGTLEEWTRLVQSHLVLGDSESAAIAYRAAIAAYPEPFGREDLDAMAAKAGLIANE